MYIRLQVIKLQSKLAPIRDCVKSNDGNTNYNFAFLIFAQMGAIRQGAPVRATALLRPVAIVGRFDSRFEL